MGVVGALLMFVGFYVFSLVVFGFVPLLEV